MYCIGLYLHPHILNAEMTVTEMEVRAEELPQVLHGDEELRREREGGREPKIKGKVARQGGVSQNQRSSISVLMFMFNIQ